MTISEAEEVAHPEGSEYGRNKVTIPRKQVPITTKLTTGRLAQLGKHLPTTPVIQVCIQMKLPLRSWQFKNAQPKFFKLPF